MSSIRGVGQGPTASMRYKNAVLSQQERKALNIIGEDAVSKVGAKFFNSHSDTEELRYVAERYRRRRKGKDNSSVTFDLDPETGQILVNVQDGVSGDFQVQLSPEQVEEVLKELEVTEDNESSLSSFFIDLKV